jgi:hypothetical protein
MVELELLADNQVSRNLQQEEIGKVRSCAALLLKGEIARIMQVVFPGRRRRTNLCRVVGRSND